MRVAIVGSRNFPDLEMVKRYVMDLPRDTVIVSGGAKGVDSAAWSAAAVLGLETIIHFPKTNPDGSWVHKGAGHDRNTLIVQDADLVRVFWDGESKGTYDTIKKTLKAKKNMDMTVRFAGQPAFSLYGPDHKS